MAGKKNELGPTGETVAANVLRLRTRFNLGYAELSRRLESLGRPIPVLGLSRIEAGERRVDVDDLTALATVFGVSPTALLMPHTDDPDAHVRTSGTSGSAREVHQWLIGRWLPSPKDEPDQVVFQALSNPRWTLNLSAEVEAVLNPAAPLGNQAASHGDD